MADEVGQVEEHAAARSAGESGDHIGTRSVRPQSQAGRLVGDAERFVTEEGFDLLAHALSNQAIVVEQRQAAEGAQRRRRQALRRQSIQTAGRHPLIDGRK